MNIKLLLFLCISSYSISHACSWDYFLLLIEHYYMEENESSTQEIQVQQLPELHEERYEEIKKKTQDIINNWFKKYDENEMSEADLKNNIAVLYSQLLFSLPSEKLQELFPMVCDKK